MAVTYEYVTPCILVGMYLTEPTASVFYFTSTQTIPFHAK